MNKLTPVSKDDLQYLDIMARALARQFVWSEDRGTTAQLRIPLRTTLARAFAVDQSDPDHEVAGWMETPLRSRAGRFIFRGLVVHWWAELFHSATFRADRYAFLMQELAKFSQDLSDMGIE